MGMVHLAEGREVVTRRLFERGTCLVLQSNEEIDFRAYCSLMWQLVLLTAMIKAVMDDRSANKSLLNVLMVDGIGRAMFCRCRQIFSVTTTMGEPETQKQRMQ